VPPAKGGGMEIIMKNNNNKKASKIKQFLPILFFMLIGAVCGVLIVKYAKNMKESGKTLEEIIFGAALLFVGMYIALFIQIIIHEAGHLIFGIMTGYHFSSFRVGSFMWLKEGKSIKFRKLSIAGTGGQCLLTPCDMKDGKYPYVLYNMGGSITNLLSAILFSTLAILYRNNSVFSAMLMMLAVVGVAYALINGIPMKLGIVNNDGYNTLSISKDREAMKSFWIQLKVNEKIASGIRLKDMPDEWFEASPEASMNNSMIAAIGVLACNRLMDQLKLSEAKQAMEKLLNMDNGIVGLHRSLITVDLIYCELVSDNNEDRLDEMLDKQQRKFMKLMKNHPSVLRTEYVYALFNGNDDTKAEQIKENFDKMVKKYPYPSEIMAERELIEYAYNKYEKVDKNEIKI
jgi:hypothetical protein